jgi:hypothetical protein
VVVVVVDLAHHVHNKCMEIQVLVILPDSNSSLHRDMVIHMEIIVEVPVEAVVTLGVSQEY